jgi:rhamnulokinase
MGNLLVQVRASGELRSLSEIREVIRQSSDVKHYEPTPASAWDEAAGRFQKLLARATRKPKVRKRT